ncbi:heavy-metal-associated domain-containing protein [Prevotella ihumii]|uniref:heavy-metal-associated domain-containing protein n=1 Tax=Prevotella ihumii TaxID=1917878 RepID=UPI000980A926|nr:cation transporter [Prevotella ihumii]
MEKQIFSVNGMKCEHCKAKVETAIKAVPGVQIAEANVAEKNVSITYDEILVSPAQLKKAVDALGKFEMMI